MRSLRAIFSLSLLLFLTMGVGACISPVDSKVPPDDTEVPIDEDDHEEA